MDPTERTISVSDEADIAVARIAGRELCERLPFDTVARYCVVTSISELATNICLHVGQGTIVLRIATRGDGVKGIEVVAEDEGPGIEDIDRALDDGFSTAGGLGGGLPGVQRLMSEMYVSSVVGKGTVVRAVRWVDERKRVPIQSPAT